MTESIVRLLVSTEVTVEATSAMDRLRGTRRFRLRRLLLPHSLVIETDQPTESQMTLPMNQRATFQVKSGGKWIAGRGRVLVALYGRDVRIVGTDANGRRVQFATNNGMYASAFIPSNICALACVSAARA